MSAAFASYGLPAPVLVPQQTTPDPDFPTVRYPNPEEGQGALQLAMDTAGADLAPAGLGPLAATLTTRRKSHRVVLFLRWPEADAHGASVILANDPDADRLAAAERQPGSGRWHLLSGNEVGVLLGWFLHAQWRAQGAGKPAAMLASAVSSRMLASMARQLAPPVAFEETLTGFKWLANHALRWEVKGYHVLLAYEEAIGTPGRGARGRARAPTVGAHVVGPAVRARAGDDRVHGQPAREGQGRH